MTFKKSDFTVGQKLYYVTRWSNPQIKMEVEIQKIGNKWLTVHDNLRFDIESLEADGSVFSSPGRAYLSKEIYDNSLTVSNELKKLGALIINARYPYPKNLTLQAIAEAKNVLGFK